MPNPSNFDDIMADVAPRGATVDEIGRRIAAEPEKWANMPKPPSELDVLRAENESLRRQLDVYRVLLGEIKPEQLADKQAAEISAREWNAAIDTLLADD